MKSSVFSWLLCLVCLGCYVKASNLLQNGGFEDGVRGWSNWCSGAECKVVKEGASEGKQALRYAFHEGEKQAIMVNYLRGAKPEAGYTLSCQVKGQANVLQVKVFFWDKDNRYLGEIAPFSGAQLGAWYAVREYFTTPRKTSRLAVGVLIKNGFVLADDFCLVEGKVAGESDNLLYNSSFRYSLSEDGMPVFWNTGGSGSYDTFQPDHEAGRLFRLAPEMVSPVPQTKVLQYKDVRTVFTLPIPMANREWYTLSVYVKAKEPGTKVSLTLRGMKPGERSFVVGTDWTRLEHTAFLDSERDVHCGWFGFGKKHVYIAAPMLERGKKATRWRANPQDATLPDLWAGTHQVSENPVLQVSCPTAESWEQGGYLDEFFSHKDGRSVRGRFRSWFRLQDGVFHAAVELDTGHDKHPVGTDPHQPQRPGNEMAELFLSPNASGSPYWHFMGGRDGSKFAQLGIGGQRISGDWGFTARKTKGGWRGEFSVPLSLISLPGQSIWRLSLCATEFVGANPFYYSCAGKNGFHSPRHFMKVTGFPVGGKTVHQPIRVAVEYDLYMKEEVAEFQVDGVTLPATLTLVDAAGKAVMRRELNNRRGRLSLSGLPEGYYEVRVSQGDRVGKSHFRKLAYRSLATRVNRFKRHLEHGGRPFFPMVHSWCCRSPEFERPTAWHLSQLRKHHYNTIMIMPEMYASWIKGNSPEHRRQIVGDFVRAGFKLIIWGRGPERFDGIQSMVDCRKQQIDELAEFQDHILGWYFVDEIGPFWEKRFNLKESDFGVGYRKLKDYAPYTLHFINWNWSGVNEAQPWYGSQDSTDIYSMDCYPYCRSINYGALEQYERTAELTGNRGRDDQLPAIFWLQTYNYMEGLREPHPIEYRNNVAISLINHQVGFMNFLGRPESNALWDGMGQAYGDALTWLDMTAQAGSTLLRKGKQGQISYALWRNGRGGYALLVANTSYTAQTANFAFKELVGRKAVKAGGNGTVTGNREMVTVSLPIAESAMFFFP